MKIAVFGYGSLVNPGSLSRTLQRPANVSPAYLDGWVRDWSVITENLAHRKHYFSKSDLTIPSYVAAVNIRPSKNKSVNGVLIACNSQEVEKIKEREIHYDMIDITRFVRGKEDFDRIYTFAGKPKYVNTPSDKAVVASSYIKIIEDGFAQISEDFLNEYFNSTESLKFPVKDLTLS